MASNPSIGSALARLRWDKPRLAPEVDLTTLGGREALWEAHRAMADGDARAKVRKIAQAIDLHLGRYQGAGL